MTISAFSSLSLDPPLVLFCIGKRSANLSAWLNGPAFSINVLSERQEALSEVFAAQNEDKFARLPAHPAPTALPARRRVDHLGMSPNVDGEAHYIIIGQVDRVEPGADIGPLLRFRGAYRSMASRR